MSADSALHYKLYSYWIKAEGQKKRIVNVACPFPEALTYALNPAPDEVVTPRTPGVLEKLWHDFRFSKRPKSQELIDFMDGMRRCLKIGLPILDAILMLSDMAKSPSFRGTIASLHLKMKEGDTFSEAMQCFPQAFDPYMIASLAAAEQVGNLPEAMAKLSHSMTQANQLRKTLISGMIYPAVVIIAGIAVVVLLSYTLIPNTIKNFTKFNMQIPWYSVAVNSAASGIRNFWWTAIPAGLAMYIGREQVGKFWRARATQKLLVKLPLISPVVRGLALSRVLRAIATLLGCGVDVRSSFRLAAEVAGHPDYRDYVTNISKNVMEGDGYYEAFMKERHLVGKDGHNVASYMMIGASTGDISGILTSLAEVQEEDAFRKTEKLPKILEPMIMTCLAAVIAVIMAAVYLPTLLLAKGVLK